MTMTTMMVTGMTGTKMMDTRMMVAVEIDMKISHMQGEVMVSQSVSKRDNLTK